MFAVELLGKMIYLCHVLLFEKLLFWMTWEYLNDKFDNVKNVSTQLQYH